MSGPTAGEIMNLDEASRYLRIKRRTLYTLAARGMVPAAKIGGQWRFRRSQLDGLFDSGHQEGGAHSTPPSVPTCDRPQAANNRAAR